MLKQPLQTSITVDNLDFEDFKVEEKLHIGISVKDFKAVVVHAETLKASITAVYSRPARPMQLIYQDRGLQCEFLLMTIGDYRGSSATPTPAATRQPSAVPAVERPPYHQNPAPVKRSSVTDAVNTTTPADRQSRSFTGEPTQVQKVQRPSPPPPKRSMNDDSLFLPAYEDEDRQWGERNYDQEEDTVGWSASAHNNVSASRNMCYTRTTNGDLQQRSFGTSRDFSVRAPKLEPYVAWPDDAQTRLAPTQKLSDVSCHGQYQRAELICVQIENLFDS